MSQQGIGVASRGWGLRRERLLTMKVMASADLSYHQLYRHLLPHITNRPLSPRVDPGGLVQSEPQTRNMQPDGIRLVKRES